MSNDDVAPVRGISADTSIIKAEKASAKSAMNNMLAQQVASAEDFTSITDQALFNPITMRKKFEKLDDRMKRPEKEEKTEKGEEAKTEEVGDAKETKKTAEDYHKRNPELHSKTLTLLQQRIKNNDKADTILRKISEFYTDKSLADEAIDFLIETATNRKELRNELLKAKEQFNAAFGREIRGGRNIAQQARAFSKAGLGSPTGLRDLYRQITGTPRPPHQLFEELSAKFKFSDMKNIIDFILHSLGSDMKSKGPSISKAELQRLFGEARNMQAILGVFRFFFARMKLIKGQFDRYDLAMPSRINFEVLSKLLMKLLQERYPSPDKIIKLSFVLGISEEVAAQIVIFTQYRDALRHISPNLFKSERHRQDLLMTMIETLSDLEDEMEDEEEEE